MFLKFVNRREELTFLEERYKKPGFEFFVIYGRRRVGKTELIKEFIKNKKHIYFLSDKSGTQKNLQRFKKSIAELLQEPIIETNDIYEIFKHLTKKTEKKELIICFDEFSYLVEKDNAIPSMFQYLVDEILSKTNIFLILCGSSISMMENGILSQKSPLYGRKTAHIRLKPIRFAQFSEFFPSNTTETNIELHSVLGGIPFYLDKFSQKKSVSENIAEQILSKKGRLYEETDFLLKEELREPDTYKSILESIASGRTKTVDISNKARIKNQDIDKYLKVLINLGFIRREQPVTETKSKKSIYIFDDNFSNFWFQFCEPEKSALEIGEIAKIKQTIKTRFPAYVGKKFEDLTRQIIPYTRNFQIQKVGKWWGHTRIDGVRKEIEIDLVALNKQTKDILFSECKWQEKADAQKILTELKEKSKYVQWNNETRKENFAIFAKSFKRKENLGGNVKLYDLSEMEKIFKKK